MHGIMPSAGTSSLRSDLALVERYDPSRGGLDYVLKQTSDPDCHWNVRNLEFFNPTMDSSSKRDHAALSILPDVGANKCLLGRKLCQLAQ